MTRLRFLMIACLIAGYAVAGTPAARMATADSMPDVDKSDWATVGRTYAEQNYSPLRQIDDRNVTRLGLAWTYDLHADRGVEAAPLEVNGVLYDVQPWNRVTALDARTGRVLWRFDPHVPPEFGRKACCDIDSRGLAWWNNRVIVATLDGRLIALDTASGKPLWSTQTFDASQPYTITGAPRVFDGLVVIGNAGADLGTRGFVTAYDAETGRQKWRFYTVPGDPSRGFEDPALEKAARTWPPQYWKAGGGGNVWDSMVYDPKLKLIYLGTGNAFPWVNAGRGDRLFAASIVAVNAETGRYVWHYQETPGDEWDYDADVPLVLADLNIGGKTRGVIMQAAKNGFFYVLDRRSGKLLSATPFVPVTWATGIDPVTGRPRVNPQAWVTPEPKMVSPGPSGAHNYNTMAYSPQTGLAYFPVTQSFFPFSSAARADGDSVRMDPSYAVERKQIAQYADEHLRAWLTAWDPVRQKEVWRVPYPRNGSGGVLATAGNLVFEGTIDQTFAAYRASDGRKLWEMPIQNIAIASAMSYELDGKQYIAVNAGWGGGTAHVEAYRFTDLHLSESRLLVFCLDGKVELPPMPTAPAPKREPPPPSRASPEQIAKGAVLYAQHCSRCHGEDARGGVKDLRQMSSDTHRQFLDIVIGGARQAKGMASFADLLSHTDAEAIHAYLIKRANEDWQGQ